MRKRASFSTEMGGHICRMLSSAYSSQLGGGTYVCSRQASHPYLTQALRDPSCPQVDLFSSRQTDSLPSQAAMDCLISKSKAAPPVPHLNCQSCPTMFKARVLGHQFALWTSGKILPCLSSRRSTPCRNERKD